MEKVEVIPTKTKKSDHYRQWLYLRGHYDGVLVDTQWVDEINQYETMVFKITRSDMEDRYPFLGDDLGMARYDTWEEAEKGHNEVVEMWKDILKIKGVPHNE